MNFSYYFRTPFGSVKGYLSSQPRNDEKRLTISDEENTRKGLEKFVLSPALSRDPNLSMHAVSTRAYRILELTTFHRLRSVTIGTRAQSVDLSRVNLAIDSYICSHLSGMHAMTS